MCSVTPISLYRRRPEEAPEQPIAVAEERAVFPLQPLPALEEIRLIRALRPPANARRPQPERYVYLARRGAEVVLTLSPVTFSTACTTSSTVVP